MYNPEKNNYEQRRKLYLEFKSIAKDKDTSHLISTIFFEKESFLVEEKEPVKGIYFILKGKIKVFNTSADKKIRILRLTSKRDLIGLSSLNSPIYYSSALVVERVKAYFINLDDLNHILKTNNKLSYILINSLAMKLRHYEMRHKHLSLFPARERIIDALLLTAYKFGKRTDEGLEISLCTSRKEIASFANTSTEKAIRTLSLLRSEKHIVIQGKKITIQDPGVLINQLTQYLYNTDESTNVNLSYPNLFY